MLTWLWSADSTTSILRLFLRKSMEYLISCDVKIINYYQHWIINHFYTVYSFFINLHPFLYFGWSCFALRIIFIRYNSFKFWVFFEYDLSLLHQHIQPFICKVDAFNPSVAFFIVLSNGIQYHLVSTQTERTKQVATSRLFQLWCLSGLSLGALSVYSLRFWRRTEVDRWKESALWVPCCVLLQLL